MARLGEALLVHQHEQPLEGQVFRRPPDETLQQQPAAFDLADLEGDMPARRQHAREFRALIGLEAADFQAPWYDTQWLNRPDVHGGEVCAALVSGLIAPQSPQSARAETLWCYKQGGPGVFKGDLYFYRVDGDLRGRVEGIDTTVCPLYLLTGEYDFSCTPDDTRRTAAAIKGASVTIMEQLGHFPMSENPEQFRRYIAPVLTEILRQTSFGKQGVHA